MKNPRLKNPCPNQAPGPKSEINAQAALDLLDCGGKSDATPLWNRTASSNRPTQWATPKRRRRGALPAQSKTWRGFVAATVLAFSTLNFQLPTFAQSTAFTYQGRLQHGGAPANGLYEMSFALHDAVTNGNAVGTPVAVAPVAVSNGLFTSTLDFGANAFMGTNRWLEVAVTVFGSDQPVVTLVPRQPLTPTPYALHAANAAGLMSFANAPLDIRVNGQRALRFEATQNSINVAGGWDGNEIISGVTGATIAGGGSSNHAGFPWPNRVSADYGTVSGGLGNRAEGSFSTVAGGQVNIIRSNAPHASIGGGGFNTVQAGTEYATIGGGHGHTIQTGSEFSTIGGGSGNAILTNAQYATISGGNVNSIWADTFYCTIGGGHGNFILPFALGATIAGGRNNTNDSDYATVGGGKENSAQQSGATVAGGLGNTSDGYSTTVGGGRNNSARGYYATIAGGEGNSTTSDYATVSGGHNNLSDGEVATIGGGEGNRSIGIYTTVGGGGANAALALGATISGGGENSSSGTYGNIGGGRENHVSDAYGTVGGGTGNEVLAAYASIGGGQGNRITENDITVGVPPAEHAVIGGGRDNVIQGGGSVIAGGQFNFIEIGDDESAGNCVIGGGGGNRTKGDLLTIAGGGDNRSVGFGATIGGGLSNQAEGWISFIGGGEFNVTTGDFAIVPGGQACRATGGFSFAAGRQARANHRGSFVWADAAGPQDYPSFPFDSETTNEFAVRATGGVRFVTAIDTNGSNIAGVTLAAGSGAWSSLSDRNAKENFASANAREILDKVAALSLASWNYKAQGAGVRHLGPMAQDFHAAFGLGESDRTIATVDADGVALAAIQGLNQVVREKEVEIQKLKSANSAIERRLAALEQLIAHSQHLQPGNP